MHNHFLNSDAPRAYLTGILTDELAKIVHFKSDVSEVSSDVNINISLPEPDKVKISKVIFNPPATVVYWDDNTKTVVKDTDGAWDRVEKAKTKKAKRARIAEWKEQGILNAIAKKFYHGYQYEFDKWIEELK